MSARLWLRGSQRADSICIQDILALLPNTPALETLYIRNAKRLRDSPAHSIIVADLPIVHLEHLRVGSIATDDVDDAAFALVQHLRVPPTGTLQRSTASKPLRIPSSTPHRRPDTSAARRSARPTSCKSLPPPASSFTGLGLREILRGPLITLLGPAVAGVHALRVSAPRPESVVECAARALWDIERDPAWKTESGYWALYPDVTDSY
ncbi:hypothetical protein BC628DRAFT_1423121 [Trametes gibbosa]|nr:hypothetical protein BC628DRAFT_1423121 [Trametes gibbosa]